MFGSLRDLHARRVRNRGTLLASEPRAARVLTAVFAASWIVLSGCGSTTSGLTKHEFSRVCMGVRTTITLYAAAEPLARDAARDAFAEVERIEQIASDYRPQSELMLLCAGPKHQWHSVSNDLFELLSIAQRVSRASGGAFDITIGGASKAWRRARDTRCLPTDAERGELLARSGWQLVLLRAHDHAALLAGDGVQLDLGGIAKGYAAQHAVRAMRRAGVPRAMVAIAGDIAAGDAPPGERGWSVGISTASRELSESVLRMREGIARHPNDTHDQPQTHARDTTAREHMLSFIRLRNASISTSGDTAQRVEIAGRSSAHLIDPRTALGLENVPCVTVWCENGALADAAATAACVLESEHAGRARSMLESLGCSAVVQHIVDGVGDIGSVWTVDPRHEVAPLRFTVGAPRQR